MFRRNGVRVPLSAAAYCRSWLTRVRGAAGLTSGAESGVYLRCVPSCRVLVPGGGGPGRLVG
jgi:hypothetical protein